MIKLSQERTKRLLAIHGWSGVILGLLLYVVIVTGAVAVFAHEIGRWSASGSLHAEPLSAGIHAPMTALASTVEPAYLDEVLVFPNSGGHLIAFFHTHAINDAGQPDDKGIMFEFDPLTKATIRQHEGFGSELFGSDPLSALDEFFVDLHVNLYLPNPWGLYATGILGLMMFVAAVSGLLIHRHLVKDIFVAPRYSSALLHKRDRHILAGSWGLPFAFVLAFTGSFFSFALSLGLPMVAKTAFGGDQMAMIGALVGAQESSDDSPATVANLDRLIADSRHQVGTSPLSIVISHWGQADAVATIAHPPAPGDVENQIRLYDAVSGTFEKTKPTLGTTPSAGSLAFDLMAALHFGHFAGLLSKIVWFSLGLAMAYVSLTGIHLWLERRAHLTLWRRFAAATTITGYGLPIAMAGSALAFFISLPSSNTHFWTPMGFLIGALGAIAVGCMAATPERRRQTLSLYLGAFLLAIPLARLSSSGFDFGHNTVDSVVVMMDLTFLIAAVWVFLGARASRRVPLSSDTQTPLALSK